MSAILYSFLGIVLAADGPPAEKAPETAAEWAAVAGRTECVGELEHPDPCRREMLLEEAEGFVSGAANTMAEQWVQGWAKKPPELWMLRGVQLQQRASVSQECRARLESLAERDPPAMRCWVGFLAADILRWQRNDKSEFGDAIKAAVARYRAYRSDSGFQATRWGMTQQEVSKAYPKATRVRDGSLVAKMVVAEFPARVRFRFVDGRLWSAEVSFDVDHTRPDQDLRKTNELRRLLSSKYGEAQIEDQSPSGEEVPFEALLRNYGGVGRAIRAGRWIMRARWFPTEMEVELTLGAEIGDYTHRLVYTSDVLVERAKAGADAERATDL